MRASSCSECGFRLHFVGTNGCELHMFAVLGLLPLISFDLSLSVIRLAEQTACMTEAFGPGDRRKSGRFYSDFPVNDGLVDVFGIFKANRFDRIGRLDVKEKAQ